PASATRGRPRAWGAADRIMRACRGPPAIRSTSRLRPGARLGAAGWQGRTRTSPRSACAATIWPTVTRSAGIASLLFDDLEDDLAIRARRGGIQDGANRFRRATLFPDDPAQVLLRHLQLEDRRGVTLGLFHLYRVGIVDEVSRE